MHGPITTPLTTLLGVQHPIILAGMAQVSGARLAAAVANAGGFPVVGGYECTPEQLRDTITEMKSLFNRPNLPFGVDVAIPKVGGGARKTNRDVTNGKLDELIAISIEHGTRMFACSAGVPQPSIVEHLHRKGILVMNVIGHPKHAVKALDAGVDIICAQGKEGRGHCGNIPTSVLIPAVVAVAQRYRPPMLNGLPAQVIAGGGVSCGPSLAGVLMQGAGAAWVSTRFVASEEANVSHEAKQAILACGFEETQRTLVLTGRPLRIRPNAYIQDWHTRRNEVAELCERGIVPVEADYRNNKAIDVPFMMGEVAGSITEILPAGKIVQYMARGAADMLRMGGMYVGGMERARL